MQVISLRELPLRRIGSIVGLVVVALSGLVLGLTVAGPTHASVGPFNTSLTITPSVEGDTEIVIPPLGSLHLDSHEGPAHLRVQLDSLDRARTEALITDPAGITRASRTAPQDVRTAVTRLVLQATAVGMLGAMALATVVYRRMRQVAIAGGVAFAVMAGAFGSALATFHPRALEEPRYEGLLANAPAVVGDARRLADRYDEYAAQLEKMVQNVGNLYSTLSNLPVYEPDDQTTRVLHVSDLHLNPAAWSVIRTVVENFHIDVVVDTGDINDWGTEPEANFVAAIALLKVPYVYVRGNHDSAVTQAAVAAQPNAIVLDDEIVSVNGLTIAGIGDPRFTPDKEDSPPGADPVEHDRRVIGVGETLGRRIAANEAQVDLALVHDPLSATPLGGLTPLVLAGHMHKREVKGLQYPGRPDVTTLMIQGSTGGAGLRGLETTTPTPLAMSILYFDQTHKLLAYDDITVGGTGLAEVRLSRHLTGRPTPEPAIS